MAAKKVGDLIKEARTKAGLSQTKLAESIEGLSASDIGKAERGEKDLTRPQLVAIAKATGVTQKSLLEAPKGSSQKTAAKTTAAKTTAAKTTAAKTSSAKTTAAKTSSAKTSSAKTGSTAAKNELTLTASEKKLVELYRAADSDTKKAAVALLKGEETATGGSLLESLLGSAAGLLGGKK